MDIGNKLVLLGYLLCGGLGLSLGWALRRVGEGAWKAAIHAHSQELVSEAKRERDRARADFMRLHDDLALALPEAQSLEAAGNRGTLGFITEATRRLAAPGEEVLNPKVSCRSDREQERVMPGEPSPAGSMARLAELEVELESGLEAKTGEIERLEQALVDRQSLVESAERGRDETLAELERQLERERDTIAGLETRLQQAESASADREAEIAALRSQLDSAGQEQRQGLEQLAEHAADAQSLEAEVERLEQALVDRQSLVESAERGRDETLAELERQLERERDTIAGLETRLQQSESASADREAEIAALRSQLDSAGQEQRQGLEQLAEHAADAQRLEAEVERLEQVLVDRQSLVESAERGRDETLAELERQLERERDTIAGLETRLQQAESASADREAEIAALRSQLDSAGQEQRQKLEQLAAHAADAKRLSAEVERLEAQCAERDREASCETDRQRAELQVMRESLECNERTLAAAEEKHQQREQELATASRELSHAIEAMSALAGENGQLEFRLRDRERQLTKQDTALGALQRKLRRARRALEQRGCELAERDARLADLDSDSTSLRRELRSRADVLLDLQRSLSAKKTALAVAHEELDANRIGRREGRQHVEEQRSSLRSLRAKLARSDASNRTATIRLRELEGELHEREELVAKKRQIVKELRGKLLPAEERAIELERRLRAYEKAFASVAPNWLLVGDAARKDDLQRIRGLGEVFESRLNDLGIYYYSQLARADQRDVEWIASQIQIPAARIVQDRWVDQARQLNGLH